MKFTSSEKKRYRLYSPSRLKGNKDMQGKKKKNNPEQSVETLKELGEMNIPDGEGFNIHCMTIVGQIEGHRVLPAKNKTTKYEHILPQMVAVEQNDKIKGLLVILNTVGGDIEAGLAIAEMLSSISKPTVSLVLGGGHSIGVPVAVAADYSYIADSASMTIHPIRLTGLVLGIPQTYEYLDRMQDRVINFVTDHSEISAKKFKNLMFRTGELVRDIGTVLIGESAVKEKIINEVGGLSKALTHLKKMSSQ